MSLSGSMDWTRCVSGIPDDFVLSVRVHDRWQSAVPASYLITVREDGPVRVHYGVQGVRGVFLHRCDAPEVDRMNVWRSVVAARLLEDGALALEDGQQEGAWLAVTGWNQSRWVPLGDDLAVRGWPVVEELERLVSAEVWQHIKVRRGLLLEALGQRAGVSA